MKVRFWRVDCWPCAGLFLLLGVLVGVFAGVLGLAQNVRDGVTGMAQHAASRGVGAGTAGPVTPITSGSVTMTDFDPNLLLVLAAILLLALAGWVFSTWRSHAVLDTAPPSVPDPPVAVAAPEPPRLPDGAAYIYTQQEAAKDRRAATAGELLPVAIGGAGLAHVKRLLLLLHLCQLDWVVGAILAIENDTQARLDFLAAIPPIYHDRLVFGVSKSFGGGTVNGPIDEVLDRIDTWGPPIAAAADETIDLYLRRNACAAPGLILVFGAFGGGQAPEGLPAVEPLHDRFSDTLIVGFATLPDKTLLRQRFPRLKREFETRGVYGWVVEDNLAADPVTADTGLVMIITGLTNAGLHADRVTKLNNALRLALGLQPGGVLIYQVVDRPVVGFALPAAAPDGAPPAHCFVFKQSLVEEVRKALRTLHAGLGTWSADLPVGQPGTATFDLVLASVGPTDLLAVQDEWMAGQQVRNRLLGTIARRAPGAADGEDPAPSMFLPLRSPDHETIFASLATVVDPARPLCQVLAIRLTAVRDGAQSADEIAKTPRERSHLSTVISASGNGYSSNGSTGPVAAAAAAQAPHDVTDSRAPATPSQNGGSHVSAAPYSTFNPVPR